MTSVSEPTHPTDPAAHANCASEQGGSTLARRVQGAGVARAVLGLLMTLPGCVIPPSLSVDTTDAGANSAPAVVSVRADGVELPEYSMVTFERGLGTLNLTVHDTDLDDKLYCKVFVDYNNPDQTPPRANSETAGSTVQRSCTLALAGLCQSDDIGVQRLMQVLVFDRKPLETGELPLYQAMPAGGLSTGRTYFLRCVEPQQ